MTPLQTAGNSSMQGKIRHTTLIGWVPHACLFWQCLPDHPMHTLTDQGIEQQHYQDDVVHTRVIAVFNPI
jgi:hypothetical protein